MGAGRRTETWLHHLQSILTDYGTGEAPLLTWVLPLRLHEFDEQVAAVREGMARVVPVPLLSLFTGYELETMVSGSTAALLAGPFPGDPPPHPCSSVHCALGGLGCSAQEASLLPPSWGSPRPHTSPALPPAPGLGGGC